MQVTLSRPPSSAARAFSEHWPEYLMEGALIGTFMIAACAFGVLLEHPMSPLYQALQGWAIGRRAVMGLAMGITAIGLISCPWGKRSGGHMNPAVTLAYLAVGKIAPWDAVFYVAFQFLGAAAGVSAANALIGPALQHSAVNYLVTLPGPDGPAVAFLAEFGITALFMSAILWASNSYGRSHFTPLVAGLSIAVFISAEGPMSGMSMNPARTLASAFCAGEWSDVWVYLTAPILAAVFASLFYVALRGKHSVRCAKLHHHNGERCIFNCRYGNGMNSAESGY
jgi:aquaporin Z